MVAPRCVLILVVFMELFNYELAHPIIRVPQSEIWEPSKTYGLVLRPMAQGRAYLNQS